MSAAGWRMHTLIVSIATRPCIVDQHGSNEQHLPECKPKRTSQSLLSHAGSCADHIQMCRCTALEEQTATLRPEQAEDLMKTGKKRKGPAIEPLDTVNESDGSSPTINGTATNGTATNGTATNGTLPWLDTACAMYNATRLSRFAVACTRCISDNALQSRQRDSQTNW
jgi:hypothetical protein